jgi:hypothetical protein
MLFKTIYSKIYNAGDKLEDKVRGRLSHYPILYAFIGGAGIIIFWRGVWHSVDTLMELLNFSSTTSTSLPALPWWDGPLSVLIGTILLLTVGLFVTSFIGNEIILSGLKKEKKLVEKTEDEIKSDLKESNEINDEIHHINRRLKRIENVINTPNP